MREQRAKSQQTQVTNSAAIKTCLKTFGLLSAIGQFCVPEVGGLVLFSFICCSICSCAFSCRIVQCWQSHFQVCQHSNKLRPFYALTSLSFSLTLCNLEQYVHTHIGCCKPFLRCNFCSSCPKNPRRAIASFVKAEPVRGLPLETGLTQVSHNTH